MSVTKPAALASTWSKKAMYPLDGSGIFASTFRSKSQDSNGHLNSGKQRKGLSLEPFEPVGWLDLYIYIYVVYCGDFCQCLFWGFLSSHVRTPEPCLHWPRKTVQSLVEGAASREGLSRVPWIGPWQELWWILYFSTESTRYFNLCVHYGSEKILFSPSTVWITIGHTYHIGSFLVCGEVSSRSHHRATLENLSIMFVLMFQSDVLSYWHTASKACVNHWPCQLSSVQNLCWLMFIVWLY